MRCWNLPADPIDQTTAPDWTRLFVDICTSARRRGCTAAGAAARALRYPSGDVAATLLPSEAEWPSLVPGRETIVWRRAGDIRVLGAAGYALILQVAHPVVGAGVSQHSNFRRDP
jgi:hypothetical protein